MKIDHRPFIVFFGIWCAAVYAIFAVAALGGGDVKMRAMLGMVSGLLLLWVALGGTVMYLLRDRAKAFVEKLPGGWPLKFILFCTALALAEEAVTTTMTNLAPAFGVKMGEVYITASASYIEVVTQHSVVVFLPMFVAWALLLSRYRFSPGSVFVLWGLTGVLAETISFGLHNIPVTGLWVFVYGLMVWLPAYSVPEDRKARAPKWYHYPLAIVAPVLFLVPLYLVVLALVSIITHL
ncbi:MAG: hypothetical protein A4E28_01940 [Methanocella sp. PtaU1.Bin125]|nr:MAG: hypothetical protein A4E28_01940 [Methanocella sp. PtaU1.Bin125]